MLNKALLTEAFELIGPDRVANGITAQHATWSECFLARAYPECDLGKVYGSGCNDAYEWVSNKVKLPLKIVNIVAKAFDFRPHELRDLAQEWLEVTNAARTQARSNSSRRSRQTVSDRRLVAAR